MTHLKITADKHIDLSICNNSILSKIDNVFKGIRQECKIMCKDLSEVALFNAKKCFSKSILEDIDSTIDKMNYNDLERFYTLLQNTFKNK